MASVPYGERYVARKEWGQCGRKGRCRAGGRRGRLGMAEGDRQAVGRQGS